MFARPRRPWVKGAFRQALVTAAVLAALSCAPASSPPLAESESGSSARQVGTPRGKLTIAWAREPDNLSPNFGGSAGGGEFRWVFNSFLTYRDMQGLPHPMIARQIPTRDNGDWVINPDGTMVTVYRLRENARWHDGTPLTAQDFAFAYTVYMDPLVAVHDREQERWMSRVESLDDHAVRVVWSEPYIFANTLGGLPPLPRHRLEDKYRANPATFNSGEEWTSAYVGTGPFRVERWEAGSMLLARAHLEWFLGPPRIDSVEIRFIGDPSALLANLLAGEVDYTSSPAIRGTEAVVARDRWATRGEGYLKTWAKRLKFLEFQYRDVPNWQRAVTDPRIRQAFLHAIDRQGLADAMTDGLSQSADAWVLPSEAIFSDVDRAITKYPFDPRRATSILQEAGWRTQPAGLLADAAGQTLDVEVNSGSSEPHIATIVADNWRGLGINANVYVLPVARQNDREFRASFPATHVGERTITFQGLHLVSSLIPTRETSFREPNRGGFSDPEVDRLHNLFVTSVDEPVRRNAAVAINKRLSEIPAYGPLYYHVDVLLAKTRVKGPLGEFGDQTGVTWNIFEWEIAD